MQINAKYFSSYEYSKDDIIIFKDGLYGFEDYHDFILIQFDKNNPNLFSLQSTEDEKLSFVILKIDNFIADYSKEAIDLLEDYSAKENLSVYGLCVLHEPISTSTVNLKCPVVIDNGKHEALQLILENSTYPFKYPFSSLLEPKE